MKITSFGSPEMFCRTVAMTDSPTFFLSIVIFRNHYRAKLKYIWDRLDFQHLRVSCGWMLPQFNRPLFEMITMKLKPIERKLYAQTYKKNNLHCRFI